MQASTAADFKEGEATLETEKKAQGIMGISLGNFKLNGEELAYKEDLVIGHFNACSTTANHKMYRQGTGAFKSFMLDINELHQIVLGKFGPFKTSDAVLQSSFSRLAQNMAWTWYYPVVPTNNEDWLKNVNWVEIAGFLGAVCAPNYEGKKPDDKELAENTYRLIHIHADVFFNPEKMGQIIDKGGADLKAEDAQVVDGCHKSLIALFSGFSTRCANRTIVQDVLDKLLKELTTEAIAKRVLTDLRLTYWTCYGGKLPQLLEPKLEALRAELQAIVKKGAS